MLRFKLLIIFFSISILFFSFCQNSKDDEEFRLDKSFVDRQIVADLKDNGFTDEDLEYIKDKIREFHFVMKPNHNNKPIRLLEILSSEDITLKEIKENIDLAMVDFDEKIPDLYAVIKDLIDRFSKEDRKKLAEAFYKIREHKQRQFKKNFKKDKDETKRFFETVGKDIVFTNVQKEKIIQLKEDLHTSSENDELEKDKTSDKIVKNYIEGTLTKEKLEEIFLENRKDIETHILKFGKFGIILREMLTEEQKNKMIENLKKLREEHKKRFKDKFKKGKGGIWDNHPEPRPKPE